VRLLLAFGMLALSVSIHTAGLVALSGWLLRSHTDVGGRFFPTLWLLVRVAWAILVFHELAIGAWAALFVATGALPDWSTAFYFSEVTYTSTGYGDVVLPVPWRPRAGPAGRAGLLMYGI
jgi:hypothetical protein